MRIVLLVVVAVLPFLGSCGKPVPPGQVAAKVNGNEIALVQLGHAIATAPAARGEATAAPARVMDAMIDEELLAQKAVKLKLDRDPRVRASIEAMRTRILAQAYMQHLAVGETQDPLKMKAFYRENPALFQERRIYRVLELAVERSSGLDAASLATRVPKAKTLGDVGAWLESQSIEFTLGAGTKAAEEIPMELLPRLASMQDGQIEVIDTASTVLVVHLVQSRDAPLDEDQALPLIEKFLRTPEFTKLVAAELKKLRDAADIEYVLDLGVPRPQQSADSASSIRP
jgi:EpsD family peptidyl-prolyl cis-trans isomerase